MDIVNEKPSHSSISQYEAISGTSRKEPKKKIKQEEGPEENKK
jgi:hypothetical protein